MTQYRTPKKTSKYYVPEQVYKATVYHCRQYPLWVSELAVEPDTSKAIDYSTDRVQTSSQYDATSEIAMHRQMILCSRWVQVMSTKWETCCCTKTNSNSGRIKKGDLAP